MKEFPFVSIIMSSNGRLPLLRNTLESWADLDYPDYEFTFIDNASPNEAGLRTLTDTFKNKLHNFSYERISQRIINQVWNYAGKKAQGEYIIFAMADEIISSKKIIQEMLNCPKERRCSVNTYFLSEAMSPLLDIMKWKSDPKIIESFPGFWCDEYAQNFPNNKRLLAGLISHVTGQSKENWEWFGWFRDLSVGHLWIDQDVHLREVVLHKGCETVPNVVCYHQWHCTESIALAPGFHYKTEREARLLDPAERDLS